MAQLVEYLEKSLFPAFGRHLQAKKVTEGADVGDEVKDEFATGNVDNEVERMKNLRNKLKEFIVDKPTDHSHDQKEIQEAELEGYNYGEFRG
jgi:hypothetical protein